MMSSEIIRINKHDTFNAFGHINCCLIIPIRCVCIHELYDDVSKWKHFLRHWPFVWEIHRSPVNSSHKGQWRGALMFSFIFVWINSWINNREAGDMRRYRAHYDVIVMYLFQRQLNLSENRGWHHRAEGKSWNNKLTYISDEMTSSRLCKSSWQLSRELVLCITFDMFRSNIWSGEKYIRNQVYLLSFQLFIFQQLWRCFYDSDRATVEFVNLAMSK